MQLQFNYPTLIMLAAAAIALLVMVSSWRRREAPGGKYFTSLMIATALWALASAGEFLFMDPAAKIVWAKFAYLGIVCVGPLWFLFAVQFSQHGAWLTRSRTSMVWVIPTIILGLVWTNEWHRYIWVSINPASAPFHSTQCDPPTRGLTIADCLETM